MKSQGKFFTSTIAILLLLGLGYYYRANAGRFLGGILARLQPCQRPITYSIGSFDSRFGLTKTEALNYINKSQKIWGSAINRKLFEYSPTGNLKINFVYDYRQQATDVLKKIGIVIGDDRANYDALKAKYDSLIASYNQQKTQVDALVAAYNADKTAYEKDISYWNSRGGAPRAEYNILQQKRTDLSNQVVTINQAENSLNELMDTINSVEIVLNKLVAALNIQVNTYNKVGYSTGKQFNEGEYISSAGGMTINIYQFNDTRQLVRVMAHEFGHALGLDHIDNPKAIMYYLNEGGINEKLTTDDLSALKNICGIK